MIRCVVAEDEPPAREKLVRWLRETNEFDVVAAVGDGIDAAAAVESTQPDVAFLDIRMPGLDGLAVAAQLERARAPLIVFVTAFDEHAVRAFDLDAIDYLLKPYDRERFERTLDRVRARLQQQDVRTRAVSVARSQPALAERLLVPQGEQWILIESSTIEWLEADDNYVHVHTAAKRYLLRRTLQDLIAQLGDTRFVRVHKSSAVQIAAIAAITPLFKGDHEIQLRSGHTVRVSRRFRESLFAALGRTT